MKLSEKIFLLRKKQGMSQEVLAEKLVVSRQAVSRWEVGTAQPDASNLLQLSKLFGVSADYLLNEEYEDPQMVPTCSGMVQPGKQRLHSWMLMGLSSFGLAGNFIIYLCSRWVEVMVPHISYRDGSTWYTYSSELTGRSYRYFIQEYELEFLTLLFWSMFLGGLFLRLLMTEKGKKVLKAVRNKLKKE